MNKPSSRNYKEYARDQYKQYTKLGKQHLQYSKKLNQLVKKIDKGDIQAGKDFIVNKINRGDAYPMINDYLRFNKASLNKQYTNPAYA